MGKEFDKEVLNAVTMSVVRDTFEKRCRVQYSADPVVVERDIIESDGRLSVSPMEKFNTSAYAATVNYFLSSRDQEQGSAVGAFVLIMKEDIMDKFCRAMGRSSKDSDDEDVLMEICGEMADMLSGNIKNELVRRGYAELFVSPAAKYRNTVRGGVPFDYSLYRKQEITFSFWNQKSVVVETCMGHVPLMGK